MRIRRLVDAVDVLETPAVVEQGADLFTHEGEVIPRVAGHLGHAGRHAVPGHNDTRIQCREALPGLQPGRGIGVFEGSGGNMRAGLSWQSVHDGEKLVHDPLRLSVCIEAPAEAMTAILKKHPQVRELFDNRWLHLFAIGADGSLSQRYAGNLEWIDAHAIE